MGVQSSFFGPVKYSLMPQHLSSKEIVGGNALVETGTFTAILLGTIAGGSLTLTGHAPVWTGLVLIGVAVAGWLVSRNIPAAPAAAPHLKIDWHPVRQTRATLAAAYRQKPIFLAMLAISWFWFVGAAYLTQMPHFTRTVLKGSADVVTLVLTMFSVGIGAGSLLCEKLSRRRVELGLVPIGLLGIGLFGVDLITAFTPPASGRLMTIAQFIHMPGSLRVLADLVLIGLFGGLTIVPLYAYVQTRSAASERARMIAANNILNALFMVAASIWGIVGLGALDLSIDRFFIILAGANLLVGLVCLARLPEFVLRLLTWGLTRIMYRVRHAGMERIPDRGAAVIVCNHVSYVDALLIAGTCPRPIRFVMYAPFYRLPFIHLICRMAKVIPIAPRSEDPATLRKAFRQIAAALGNDEVVCIFPEGRLTRTGNIDTFKTGIERIVRDNPVPVIPMALQGMWGSFFSHCRGTAMTHRPRGFRSRIGLAAGDPLAPETVTAAGLHSRVAELMQMRLAGRKSGAALD
jgi:1-acyl-sn-glycerol-3-phosphate acyltransferase